MKYEEWPNVTEALAALREKFGDADLMHTGGGCFSIYVPVKELGYLSVGDIDGPLGESNQGWSVELIDTDGDYAGLVCKVPDRNVRKLVEALRAFVRDGTRTGLTPIDLLYMRRDKHHADAGHLVNPTHIDDPKCTECQEIHRAFRELTGEADPHPYSP